MAPQNNSLYTLLDVPRQVTDLGGWAGVAREFTHVVGYSDLGHMLITHEGTSMYAVLYPFRNAYKAYGPFGSTTEFEQTVLRDPAFQEFALRPAHVAAIAETAGPLGPGQVYIPVPYPFLGGSEDDPRSYDRGDVWVFWAIVDQMLSRV